MCAQPLTVLGPEKAYRAALAGSGPEFEQALRFLHNGAGEDVPLRLVAVACPGGSLPEHVSPSGLDVYPDALSMLAGQPGLDVILDFESDPADRALRQQAPDEVLVFGPSESLFLLTLLDPETVCRTCRTDLTRTKHLLNTVIDELREDVLLLDTEGRIVDCNRNVWERRGRKREDYVGYYFWEALEEEENLCRAPEYDCPFGKTVHTGKKSESLYTMVDDDGKLHYYRVYTYPVRNDLGQLTHVAEMRRDITRRTHMEQRLQQSERLASIGELSTYIAHEIRNPLFTIAGFANSLQRNGNLDEQAAEKVSIILKESQRLDAILKSLLNFTRPTEGETGRMDVNQLVRDTLEIMSMNARQLKIHTEFLPQEDLPLAKGDPEMVKQSLINLVKNAKEAMPEGGELTLRTYLRRGYVAVEVTDTGVGIPAENLPKVFNPFFSTKDKGAGLGLAMTKKILDDLGGDVQIESVEGEGTTVRLLLPPLLGDDDEPAGALEGKDEDEE
ncbi:two-component system sensor histidine kinase NtrB [Desulfohalovibrio reitneri]|uniref:two-component system sensor histidine kinase NtrB n=1 Tax=Desulfohalovibrio reitneri TaxID=1307759 RepID=UPI00069201B0|nr:ATP-binding protein [Desulfohalovibrio reitneri]